jgi:Domain of unknown function (DUF4118)
MEDGEEGLFYLSMGPLAAVFLGMALVPLRGFTTASNLTFVFLILTIVIAELGGRWAAVATALCSALSLDFFLTQPYLKLSIADKHDLIAFVGLMVCGLSVAALGSTRARQIANLKVTRRHRELLNSVLSELSDPGPLESQLTRVVDATRAVLPLAALAVRDGAGQVLAASADAHSRPAPELILQPDLLPPGTSTRGVARPGDIPFPVEGARLALVAANRQVGWLDLWGNGVPASTELRRTLADVALVVAVLLAGIASEPPPEGRGIGGQH